MCARLLFSRETHRCTRTAVQCRVITALAIVVQCGNGMVSAITYGIYGDAVVSMQIVHRLRVSSNGMHGKRVYT